METDRQTYATSTTKGCVLMFYPRRGTRTLLAAATVVSLIAGTISAEASTQGSPQEKPTSNVSTSVRIPNRADKPLFRAQQGKQKTEIHYDRATGIVTLKLLVQDPNGYFIPNIRRGNFVVYENGVRQQDVEIGVEHAPVSLALLMEHGGHHPGLNRAFCEEVSRTAHQVLNALGPDDKLAIWTYGDTMKEALEFSSDHQLIENALFELRPPGVSEINLYDALISASERMRRVSGRKAVLLMSSGVDTFSRATYEDAVKAVRDCNTPIYVISMLPTLRNDVQTHGPAEVMKAIDSRRAEKTLIAFSQVSGGRFYVPENTLDLSGMYDDVIENLKVRYVLTYKSSIHTDATSPRNVRFELVNPSTGGPLQIVDASGRMVRAKVVIQDSYTLTRR
jgi:VWFA-related protein